jgi:outer membrane protein assembly factor BamB
MTTPVIWSDMAIAAPTSREMFAWRLADGKEVWHTQLPSATAMGNPLLFDSSIVVGLETTSVCVLNASSGKIIFCHSLAFPRRGVWGAGHASAAATKTSIFQVFVEGTRLNSMVGVFATAMKAMGMPDQFWDLEARQPMEQVLVSLAWDGSERWRIRLGPGRNPPAGHVAGTPTVEDGVIYVPSPLNGRVIAVDENQGNMLWSTEIKTARGSVSLTGPYVFAATTDGLAVILDKTTGQVRCREKLPGVSDRAGLTISGNTGILTLRNGIVMARPMADWLSCAA